MHIVHLIVYIKEMVKTDLAEVIKTFGNDLSKQINLSPQQTKVLYHIGSCRTPLLGRHKKEVCDTCGTIVYRYNSCGDRHCPKCQHSKQIKWIEKLQKESLAVKHYHIIFTVPHSLNAICLWNKKLYYNLLFKSVWETLRSFGYTKYNIESGAIAVLHSWGQNLSLHPHIHCIVPAAGVNLKGEWKLIGKNDKYLYPVKQLSDVFKGKFLYFLQKKLKKANHQGFEVQINKAFKTKWVVYCEAPLSGVKQVIKYLGQYTHRIAISNQRILGIYGQRVKFLAKDYRDNATVKKTQLDGSEFLRRFIQHILPKGFMRIRRYGIYNATTKRNLDLQFEQEKSGFDKLLEKKEQEDLKLEPPKVYHCPICKEGKLIVVKTYPKIRSPAGDLPEMLRSLFKK